MEAVERHANVDVPAVSAAVQSPRRRAWNALRGVAAVAAVVLLLGIVWLHRFTLPAPTGPYAVGTRTWELTDASRHEEQSADASARRIVVAQIWYPTKNTESPNANYQRWRETKLASFFAALLPTHSHRDAAIAEGVHTVLLYGPRWGGERTQNTALIEDLASHGYVVAAIDHPYNASRVLVAGKVVRGGEQLEGPAGEGASAAQRIAYWNSTLAVWAADERFVLDELARRNANANDDLYGHLNTETVGALGHSFGGAAALRLLGLDARVKAAVNLDGWTFGALADRSADQALMIVYEQEARDRRAQLLTLPAPGLTQDELDRADNAAVDASVTRFGGDILYVRGTQHLDFSDRPLMPPLQRRGFTGPIAPREIDDILRVAVRAFFDEKLQHAAVPSDLGMQRFAEVTEETHAPAAAPPAR